MVRWVRSSTMSRGVGQGASEAVELGDHRVSQARQAARDWYSPGRSRFRPLMSHI